MPPKRRRICPPCPRSTKTRVCNRDPCGNPCPSVDPVPKLLVKGGIEVLNVETGPDAITTIELFLEPRMGVNNYDIERYSDWYGYSYDIKPPLSDPGNVNPENLPTYSAARVGLPMLNEDMTCDTLLMWEAVSVKTEVVGANAFTNQHIFNEMPIFEGGAGIPIQGASYHMFAVGGEPLDLQGIVNNYKVKYPKGNNFPITIETVTGKPMTPRNHGLDPNAKAVLDKDGYYPVEIWTPDPAKNENTRYYGSYTGGERTPPVLQFTNTLTTVLLDENGVGPLCKGDGVFVSCADLCGFFFKANPKSMAWRGLPRYFSITLRKRRVKNPYPVSSLLARFFTGLMPKITGQPMEGQKSQVEEVRIYEGSEPLPGDPDITRYIDKFGQEKTSVPEKESPEEVNRD